MIRSKTNLYSLAQDLIKTEGFGYEPERKVWLANVDNNGEKIQDAVSEEHIDSEINFHLGHETNNYTLRETKEFIKKNDEFTVNIALIHKNTPVLGVVYAPAINEMYKAKKGEGAFNYSWICAGSVFPRQYERYCVNSRFKRMGS